MHKIRENSKALEEFTDIFKLKNKENIKTFQESLITKYMSNLAHEKKQVELAQFKGDQRLYGIFCFHLQNTPSSLQCVWSHF